MHLEPTSRCTLACPACPRTWFADTFDRPFAKHDLDLDLLERFLDCEAGSTVSKFTLCGNHGDPIYYPKLLQLVKQYRSSKTFKIVTNGSFQTKQFWHALGDQLTPDDTLVFSIDGLAHNNHLYRVNSNWQSIMDAVDIMVKKPVTVIWKTIVFAHNQHEIEQIKKFALDKGCEFEVHLSNRFGKSTLQPALQYVNTDKLYRKFDQVELTPRCFDEEYISADGYYWPCCMITNYFTLHKTVLWQQRQQWSISQNTLDQTRRQLTQWQQSIQQDPGNAHDVCKMHCKKGQATTDIMT